MPLFKRSKKPSKWRFINISCYTPLSNVKDTVFSFRDLLMDGSSRAMLYIRTANFFRKDLYTSNMHLAVYHLENNNIFDAKLRYNIAHIVRNKLTAPILGLADIAIHQRNHKKAIKYFKKALSLSTLEAERAQINQIMQEL